MTAAEIQEKIGLIEAEKAKRNAEKEMNPDDLEKITGGRYFDTPEYEKESMDKIKDAIGPNPSELSEDDLDKLNKIPFTR